MSTMPGKKAIHRAVSRKGPRRCGRATPMIGPFAQVVLLHIFNCIHSEYDVR
jgi:hypothetical protein